MTEIKPIIEKLKRDIQFEISCDADLNAKSWGEEAGILISVNEATTLVSHFEQEGDDKAKTVLILNTAANLLAKEKQQVS